MPGEDAFIETFTLPLVPEDAFFLFIDEASVWWPSACTLSDDTFDRMAIDASPGGRCVEFDRHGNMFVWGRVLEVERPTRIAISWHITADLGLQANAVDASRLRIRFEPQGKTGSAITFVHQGLKNQADWQAHLERLSGARGWPSILGALQAEAARRAG